MKKIFTLSVAVLMLTSAFAQNRDGQYNKGKDVVVNDGGFRKAEKRSDNFYAFSAKERDMQIAQINREYDRKIMDVKRNFFLSRFKKDQKIARLQDQRRDEIKTVYAKFNDRNNHYGNDWGRH